MNKNFVHQFGNQPRFILRCTVNQSSRTSNCFGCSLYFELSAAHYMWQYTLQNSVPSQHICLTAAALDG